MHPQQRLARFNLVIVSIAVGLSAASCILAFAYLGAKGIWAGFAPFALLAITGTGYGNRMDREGRDGSVIIMDEAASCRSCRRDASDHNCPRSEPIRAFIAAGVPHRSCFRCHHRRCV